MSETLAWPEVILRLTCSIVSGVVIGLDRSVHAYPAGLRTTVLVSVAVAMIQANWLVVHMADTHVSILRLDMMRLPLGVLSGIGFIGAGAILRRGDMIRGITTAATIWLVTIIGLCFGGGQNGLGFAVTAIAFMTLWLLKGVEGGGLIGRRGTITITVAGDRDDEASLCSMLAARGFQLRSRRVELVPGARMQFICSGRHRGPYPGWSHTLVRELAAYPDVTAVEWRDIIPALAAGSFDLRLSNCVERRLARLLVAQLPKTALLSVRISLCTARYRLMCFNDHPRMQHQDVLSVCDRAIDHLAHQTVVCTIVQHRLQGCVPVDLRGRLRPEDMN